MEWLRLGGTLGSIRCTRIWCHSGQSSRSRPPRTSDIGSNLGSRRLEAHANTALGQKKCRESAVEHRRADMRRAAADAQGMAGPRGISWHPAAEYQLSRLMSLPRSEPKGVFSFEGFQV